MLDTDMSTPKGQRQANIDKRRADTEVEVKYKAWMTIGKSDVDEVLGKHFLKNTSFNLHNPPPKID